MASQIRRGSDVDRRNNGRGRKRAGLCRTDLAIRHLQRQVPDALLPGVIISGAPRPGFLARAKGYHQHGHVRVPLTKQQRGSSCLEVDHDADAVVEHVSCTQTAPTGQSPSSE